MTPTRSRMDDYEDKIIQKTGQKDHLIVSVKKLQRIQDTFSQDDETAIGILKIQELLMSVEKNVDGELAAPLIFHYSQIKTVTERITLLNALRDALDQNEDVLLALSNDVYKALLNFLLRAFAKEKEYLDRESLSTSQAPMEQNEVTSGS